jgi:hypothetical protein
MGERAFSRRPFHAPHRDELKFAAIAMRLRSAGRRSHLNDFLFSPIERFQPDCTVDAGRFARGTALRLLAMARHVASPRLVPQANRLGLAWYSQAGSALAPRRRQQRSAGCGIAAILRCPTLRSGLYEQSVNLKKTIMTMT